MVSGDPRVWADRFRPFEGRFLERVAAVWPACLETLASLSRAPEEDEITLNLVELLKRDPVVLRSFHWVQFHHEPVGSTSEGLSCSLGEVDIAVFLTQDHNTYLAYECKRLNVRRADGRRTLATEYVKCGVSRFVRSQYSRGLPVGCMLGYVLDGDMAHAVSSVRQKIIELRSDIGLVDELGENLWIGEMARFYSRHWRDRECAEIEVGHTLLRMWG